VGWLVGGVVGYYVAWGIASIDALVVAGAAYYGLSAVAAIKASVSLTERWMPARRQSATSRAQATMTASVIGIGSAHLASARVSARNPRVAASAALKTPGCSPQGSPPTRRLSQAGRPGAAPSRAR
jgi:hypothetical protein